MSDIRARADSLMPNPELQRILIVEDDQDIAELVAHQLVKSGYEVDIVSAGDEVLPALEPVSYTHLTLPTSDLL